MCYAWVLISRNLHLDNNSTSIDDTTSEVNLFGDKSPFSKRTYLLLYTGCVILSEYREICLLTSTKLEPTDMCSKKLDTTAIYFE